MFSKKVTFVVGLTTYNTDLLEISIPALGRLGQRFMLIIHNDNPDAKVTTRQIRNLGYHGKLHIINSDFNVGLIRARCNILKYMTEHQITPTWMTFVDDDDMLTDISIPSVSDTTFAIVQNMAVIRTRLIDVLRMARHGQYTIDDENVFLVRPHIGVTGTIIRTKYLIQWRDIIEQNLEQISDIDASITFQIPSDLIMWSGVNIIATQNGDMPIYMDNINYVATDIDSAQTKYNKPVAPDKNAPKHIRKIIDKYDAIIRNALNAAPAGQD